MKSRNKIVLVLIIAGLLSAAGFFVSQRAAAEADLTTTTAGSDLPKLLDLGSKTCIPCQMMAPILDELTREYAGRFNVEFVDVGLRENISVARQHQISAIPTQIFFDKDGRELFRHEGFLSKEDILAKWQELGYDFGSQSRVIERWEPAQKDDRAPEEICYMCDHDIPASTAVAVSTDKGAVRLCTPHCYFIMYSSLTQDRTGFEDNVSVTDFATGDAVPAAQAVYLSGLEQSTGRPWVKAFASADAALEEMRAAGGSVITWAALQTNELSHRCGFCDRSCHPQDAAKVIVEGLHSYGCCAHCSMGVAARTGKNIEVHQPDGLTGEIIVIKTLDGKVASIDPSTAVAWYGKKKTPDGKWVSAGCFHQAFFATPENLVKWLEKHPLETGEMISIQQSLADKMKLSPQQIQNACKIGECAPK